MSHNDTGNIGQSLIFKYLIAQKKHLVGKFFLRDFAFSASGNLCITIFSALSGILAARLLGPYGRGVIAAATSWAGVFGMIAQLGLPQAIIYSVARNPELIGSLFVTTMGILLFQSLIILSLVSILIFGVFLPLKPAAADVIFIYLFSIPCSLMVTYLSAMLQGLKQFKLFALFQVAPSAAFLLSLVVSVLLGLREPKGVVILILASQILVSIFALICFISQTHSLGRFSFAHTRQLLGYGIKSYLGNLSWFANVRLDQFVMSIIITEAALGLYSVAVSYATILLPLSHAFSMVLFPSVVRDERTIARAKIAQVLKLNFALSTAAAVTLAFLCPILLPAVFGVDFGLSVYPAMILLAGTVFLGSNLVLGDGFRGRGKPMVATTAEMIGVLITIIGLSLFLQKYGILAAASVSTFSYGTVFLFLVISFTYKRKL